MKNKQKVLVALAVGVFGYIGAANANHQDTLANLVANNGTVSIGDKVFSNFEYLATAIPGFDANNITVTASYDNVDDIYYLTWGGAIATVAGNFFNSDLLLNYTVTASAGLIDYIDQSYTGSSTTLTGPGNGYLVVDESVRNGNVTVANSHLDNFDLSDPFAEVGDNLNLIPALASVDVTKDIAFGFIGTGPNAFGIVTISEIRQSFHQARNVPEGGLTLVLLGSALAGLSVGRRFLKV